MIQQSPDLPPGCTQEMIDDYFYYDDYDEDDEDEWQDDNEIEG